MTKNFSHTIYNVDSQKSVSTILKYRAEFNSKIFGALMSTNKCNYNLLIGEVILIHYINVITICRLLIVEFRSNIIFT